MQVVCLASMPLMYFNRGHFYCRYSCSRSNGSFFIETSISGYQHSMMFSLTKLALHEEPLDKPLSDIQWTSHEPSPPFGLWLHVDSGFVKATKGNAELFNRRLGDPNRTVIKGAFGELNLN